MSDIKMSDVFDLPFKNNGYNSFLTDNFDQTKAAIHAINSHDNLVEQNKALKDLLSEASEYLDTNSMTNIGSGSVLHTKFKEALEQAK